MTKGSFRGSWSSLLATIVLAVASPSAVMAAPTCQNQRGDAVRCGSVGALPVGQLVPSGQRAADREPVFPQPAVIFGLVCVIGGVFALIALMPRFGGDWDKQQDDDEG